MHACGVENPVHAGDIIAQSKATVLQEPSLMSAQQQQTVAADKTGQFFPAGTEMVQAGQFDQLVCEIMELLDQYTGKLGLKRKRSQGEDKYEEGKLDQAVAELKQKMRRWGRSYHGQVEFLLCYAMAGGHVDTSHFGVVQ
ncbi:hypothetical protein WJX77_004422 [Trebouxia sp. C0004]